MADRKITDHTVLTGPNLDPVNDQLEVIDVTDNTDAATGTNKKITPKELLSKAWVYFRNFANTFDSILTNTNTAIRTYTFQDRSGTIADTYLTNVRGSTLNRYFDNAVMAGANGTVALTVNQLRAMPWIVKAPMTLDRIACEITAGTTGNIRIGIYNDDGTGQPGSLILDSGQLAVSAPGVLSANINLTLLPGLYWLVYLTDTANTARAIVGTQMPNVIGYPATLGNTMSMAWIVSKTYGALPDPFTPGFNAMAGISMPIITLRQI